MLFQEADCFSFVADYFLIKHLTMYRKQCSLSAEVMMDRHSRWLANIKPALAQPTVIIRTVLNNN